MTVPNKLRRVLAQMGSFAQRSNLVTLEFQCGRYVSNVHFSSGKRVMLTWWIRRLKNHTFSKIQVVGLIKTDFFFNLKCWLHIKTYNLRSQSFWCSMDIPHISNILLGLLKWLGNTTWLPYVFHHIVHIGYNPLT